MPASVFWGGRDTPAASHKLQKQLLEGGDAPALAAPHRLLTVGLGSNTMEQCLLPGNIPSALRPGKSNQEPLPARQR